MNLKSRLVQLLKNFGGWTTSKRIIVFESDDWGAIRMPSRDVYETLLSKGIRVDHSKYNKFDALETDEDLQDLFEVLTSVKDIKGNYPVFTANCLMANPDFDKIRATNFTEYHFETFLDTYVRHKENTHSFELWKKGMETKIFFPQFHGREHLNVNRWMQALREGSEETRMAFDHNMFGLSVLITKENRRSYMAAFDFDNVKDIEDQKKIIHEGLELFEKLIGYKSESFIAPNNTWHPDLAEALKKNGIKYIQGGGQKIPDGKGVKLQINKLGSKNKFDQIFLMRNCQFEPTSNPNLDWIDSTMKDISVAFLMRKPAVISTHRINFSGRIHAENKAKNNEMLGKLLKAIVKKWPDVMFLNSVELGKLIKG